MKDDHFNYQSFVKGMQMIHSLIKMDIRLHDQNQKTTFQFINHSIPVVLNQSDHENVSAVHEILKSNEPNYYYHYIDPYGFEYIGAGIWKKQNFHGSIIIGPVISSLSIVDVIHALLIDRSIPVSERQSLEQFYHTLPILSDEEMAYLGELLVHLTIHHQIHYGQITSGTPEPTQKPTNQHIIIEENTQLINERYMHQNELMAGIAKGDKAKALKHIEYFIGELVSFSDRIPGSPIRASKNIGFVLNTICRIAAERSGVHPAYLHHISERFAILIERTNTMPNLKNLYLTIVEEYCDLVITFSTGKYSPIVKKAMDYILLNLGSPLPLQQIAEHVHVNSSHLSRKFKEDTGMTITDFINHKRIEEAKYYLEKGNASITDVAFLVGFNDLNYFSKVFKRLTTMTPSEYTKRRSP